MKVMLRTILAGPQGTGRPGQVIDVNEQMGQDLIAGGYAEAAETGTRWGSPPASDSAPAPEPETAASPEAETRETAATRTGKPKAKAPRKK